MGEEEYDINVILSDFATADNNTYITDGCSTSYFSSLKSVATSSTSTRLFSLSSSSHAEVNGIVYRLTIYS